MIKTTTLAENKESTTKVDNLASITTSQTASLTSSNEQHQPTESNSDSDSDTDDENKQEGEEDNDNDNDNGNKRPILIIQDFILCQLLLLDSLLYY